MGIDMGTEPKILIVDDEVDFATDLCTILEDNGFIADTAHDLDSTLNKTKETEYDVTFMDMSFPDTNGLEIFKKIKEIRPDAKVVIMTGDPHTVSELYMPSINAGMIDDSFLRKPFSPDEMIDIINKHTSK